MYNVFAFDQSFASTAIKKKKKKSRADTNLQRRVKALPTLYLLDDAKVLTQIEVWRNCNNSTISLAFVFDEDGSFFTGATM